MAGSVYSFWLYWSNLHGLSIASLFSFFFCWSVFRIIFRRIFLFYFPSFTQLPYKWRQKSYPIISFIWLVATSSSVEKINLGISPWIKGSERPDRKFVSDKACMVDTFFLEGNSVIFVVFRLAAMLVNTEYLK